MAPSAPQTYKDINPDQYAKLTEKAKGAGIEMQGNSGSASKFGVEVAWKYAPETQELTLQCMKTPFFVKAADVDAKLRDLVHLTLA
jgi:hypothetical protein